MSMEDQGTLKMQHGDPRRQSHHQWEWGEDGGILQKVIIDVIDGRMMDQENMAREKGSRLPLTRTP